MAECADEIPSFSCEGEEEIAILQEIYINELSVESSSSPFPRVLSLQLHPATCEDVDQQFVCLTLQLKLPFEYPNELPEILIKNPRGLADQHISSLRQSLTDLARDRQDGPMLYELIEMTKESLTQCNLPHGQCVICLGGFERGQPFTRTPCYHYFHCQCLLCYVTHCLAQLKADVEEARIQRHQPKQQRKQVVCPVCREPISDDVQSLDKGQVLEEVVRYKPSAEMRLLQQKMAQLFKVQKAKGGIIDLEEEKNKYLVPAGLVLTPSSNNLEAMASEVTTDANPQASIPQKVERPESSRITENGNRGRRSYNYTRQPAKRDQKPKEAATGDQRPSTGQRRSRGRYGPRRQDDRRKSNDPPLRKVNTWPKKNLAEAETQPSSNAGVDAPPGFSRRKIIRPPPGFHEDR